MPAGAFPWILLAACSLPTAPRSMVVRRSLATKTIDVTLLRLDAIFRACYAEQGNESNNADVVSAPASGVTASRPISRATSRSIITTFTSQMPAPFERSNFERQRAIIWRSSKAVQQLYPREKA